MRRAPGWETTVERDGDTGDGDGAHGPAASSSAGVGEGEDGTDPVAFAALLLAGMAAMADVAALIFATKRAPS